MYYVYATEKAAQQQSLKVRATAEVADQII
jgi:hypothetical protein